MINEQKYYAEILRLGNLMVRINDIDHLMETILTLARNLSNADAGSIYKHEEGSLIFKYTQNDTMQRKLPPGRKLPYSTYKMPVSRKTIAGYVAETGESLNIPDVYTLDQHVPYRFGREYDLVTKYKTRSMLTLPLKTANGEIVGVLQLLNAMDEAENIVPFPDEIIEVLEYFANTAAVMMEKAEMTRTLILRTIRMAELRDPKETGSHVNRVGAYSAEIYESWAFRRNLPAEEIARNKDMLRVAAMLHDVGKVGTTDLILKKPGRLTAEEYEIMKEHAFIGAKLLADGKSDLERMAFSIALSHHERWDGNGYPGHVSFPDGKPISGKTDTRGKARGRHGEEIPLWGRIVALADVYDALSRRRVYKEAWPEEKVLEEIRNQSGSQFDPELVEAFFECLDDLRRIFHVYPDEME